MELPANPRRIVSLAPSLTESLFALGLGDRVVGTAEFSNFPAAAGKIPVVGSLGGDPERILAVHPDVVIATTEGNDRRVVERLESFSIPVFVSNSRDLIGVIDGLVRLGRALGRDDEAKRLAASMNERLRAIEARPRAPKPPRVAWLVWPDPVVVAGGGNFIDDIIRRAGGENVFTSARSSWPTIGIEQLAAADVDVILFPSSPESRAAFDRALAGPLGKVLPVRVARIAVDGDRAERPGPRLVEALDEISRVLRSLPAR